MNSFKKHSLFFILLSVTFLSTIPIYNIFYSERENEKGFWEEFKLEKIYNVDKLLSYKNYAFYKMGISADTNKAIVGNQGWLFLGNSHNQALAKSTGQYKPNVTDTEQWANAMFHRQKWLSEQGIPMLVFVAPNKHSIYYEHLPHYIKLSSPNSTDILLKTALGKGVNIHDLRPGLLKAKNDNNSRPLYQKTDSHWNNLGAAIAAQEMLEEINKVSSIQAIEIDSINPTLIPTGDVAKQLRIENFLPRDLDVNYKITTKRKLKDACVEAGDPEKFIFEGDCKLFNGIVGGISNIPKRTYHPAAASEKSLLWLRDSFGTAASIFFTTAFKETWQNHHYKMRDPKDFRQFVEKHNPDIVVFLIVERSLTNSYFTRW